MKKLALLSLVFLLSCASSTKLFTSIQNSNDATYGYSVNNPILIGHYSSWQKNTELAYIYLSKLNKNGHPLKMILHATVEKPEDQPRKRKSIPNLYRTPTSMGGIFLSKWIMVPQGTTDTLALFFDVEIEGVLKVPVDLTFDINQKNNIYR
jgi:hypothetical protein